MKRKDVAGCQKFGSVAELVARSRLCDYRCRRNLGSINLWLGLRYLRSHHRVIPKAAVLNKGATL